MDTFEQLSPEHKVIILALAFFVSSVVLGLLVLGDTPLNETGANLLEFDEVSPHPTVTDPYAPLHLP